MSSQKITPFLWFDNQAEEAAQFYTGIFKNAKINSVSRYGEGAPLPAGTAMTVSFTLDGLHYTALNGGPSRQFNEAISFITTVVSLLVISKTSACHSRESGNLSSCHPEPAEGCVMPNLVRYLSASVIPTKGRTLSFQI